MVMAWGQFIDHDLVATPVTKGETKQTLKYCESKMKYRCISAILKHGETNEQKKKIFEKFTKNEYIYYKTFYLLFSNTECINVIMYPGGQN